MADRLRSIPLMLVPVLVTALVAAAPGPSVRIDGAYGLGVVFENRFHAVETVSTHGTVPSSFQAGTTTDDGDIRIWHLPNDGKFIVSRAEGSYTESVKDARGQRSSRKALKGTSEFDALGYAKSRADDAADLIPIFPEQMMSAGGAWHVHALVEGPFGKGNATYDYHVLTVTKDQRGHDIATFSLALSAALTPPKTLAGWSSKLAGSGLIVWDCTEHQRVHSKTQLSYTAAHGSDTLSDVQNETDNFTRVK